ncbi:MAG TPA: TadE/TadG family type IV pilus assembly protein [Flexivirga sp.]|uniref:TadE/TadG family type IV pilus assembly protein n=1 Tax=Flexivirga sp. TaxID=1962927 RepID=UPI002CA0F580|nr:TadE/TadG family type IV pilus assembly protein [Flexivirga sp.]HWC21374.1 TadE/TadG family type IV pilus assembly protein [Flexivirga sp.]
MRADRPRDVRHQRKGDESGSATAEFALVGALVVIFFLAAFQVGFSLYVRNTLIENAAEGARYGARADATPAMGAQRAAELIRASLADKYASNVSATTELEGGAQVVKVTVRAPLPIVGPFGPSQSLTVSGRAYAEAQ